MMASADMPMDPTFCYYASKPVKQGLTVHYYPSAIIMDAFGLSIAASYGPVGRIPSRAIMLTHMNISGASGTFTIPAGSSTLVIISGFLTSTNSGLNHSYAVMPAVYTIADLSKSLIVTVTVIDNGSEYREYFDVGEISGATITARGIAKADFVINIMVL